MCAHSSDGIRSFARQWSQNRPVYSPQSTQGRHSIVTEPMASTSSCPVAWPMASLWAADMVASVRRCVSRMPTDTQLPAWLCQMMIAAGDVMTVMMMISGDGDDDDDDDDGDVASP